MSTAPIEVEEYQDYCPWCGNYPHPGECEEEGHALETRGRNESHEEGEHSGEAEGMERDRESRVGERRDGWVSDPSSERSGGESGSTKREQDLEFEERTSIEERCMRCGAKRGHHAHVRGFSEKEPETVFLICPNVTFTVYR